MGWCYTRWDYKSIRDFFENQFQSGREEIEYKVLDAAMVKYKEAYAAILYKNKTKGTEEVFAATYLINFNRSYDYNFGYKDMSENSGPGMINCPERILKLLTPTDNEYAIQWRKDNWERINKRKEMKKIPRDVGTFFYYNDKLQIITQNYKTKIYFAEVFIDKNSNEIRVDSRGRVETFQVFAIKLCNLCNYNIYYNKIKDLEIKLKLSGK
jgi:hypothetical protein